MSRLAYAAYVDVWIPQRIGPLTYGVTDLWKERTAIGKRVILPFRKRQWRVGVVVRIHSKVPKRCDPMHLRPILSVVDEHPLVSHAHIRWWEELAAYYLAPEGLLLLHALPAALLNEERWYVVADNETVKLPSEAWSEKLEAEGVLTLRQLADWRDDRFDFETQLSEYLGCGVLRIYELPMGQSLKIEEQVRMSNHHPPLERLKRTPAQAAFWKAYFEVSHRYRSDWVPLRAVFEAMGKVDRRVLHVLRRRGVLTLRKRPLFLPIASMDPLPEKHHIQPLPWEKAPTEHVKTIYFPWGRPGAWEHLQSVLLNTLRQDRQALLIVPDAWAVRQAIHHLAKRFAGRIVGILPDTSEGELLRYFHAARTGKACIFVGTRQPIFWQFGRPGAFCVVGESHSFMKNSFDTFAYHVRDVLMFRSRSERIPLYLSSYVPSIETYFNVRRGRIVATDVESWLNFPPIDIWDLRSEAIEGHPLRNWSPFLQGKVRKVINQGGRALIIANQRGTGAFLRCIRCHWMPRCERCNVGLTYHARLKQLRCPYCDLIQPLPSKCPECGAASLHFGGDGVEGIAASLRSEYPNEVVALERSSYSSLDAYAVALNPFIKGQRRILVGTPYAMRPASVRNVDLLIITAVDSLLLLPSYRALEQLWGILAKAALLMKMLANPNAQCWVATHYPDHPIWEVIHYRTAEDFYKSELQQRREFGYPPYQRLIKLSFRNVHSSVKGITTAVETIKKHLRWTEILWNPEQIYFHQGVPTMDVLLKMPSKAFHYRMEKRQLQQMLPRIRQQIAPIDLWINVDPQR